MPGAKGVMIRNYDGWVIHSDGALQQVSYTAHGRLSSIGSTSRNTDNVACGRYKHKLCLRPSFGLVQPGIEHISLSAEHVAVPITCSDHDYCM